MSIKEDLERRKENKKMYTVNTFFPENPLSETKVSFSLPYLDWCEIEESPQWKEFQKLLEEVQNRDNNSLHQENQFQLEK